MNRPAFRPLQNTALPQSFRMIRLGRAREHDHPEGAPEIGYVIVAPLDATSQIDVETWQAHRRSLPRRSPAAR